MQRAENLLKELIGEQAIEKYNVPMCMAIMRMALAKAWEDGQKTRLPTENAETP